MYRAKGSILALFVFYVIFGVFCLLLALFAAMFAYFSLSVEPISLGVAGLGLAFAVVGILGVVAALGEIRLLRCLKRMQIVLSAITDTPVSVVAANWGVSVEEAEKMLKTMIRRKHIRKVSLDTVNHRLVLYGKLYYGEHFYRRADLVIKQVREKPVMVEVECESCGATNTIEKGRRSRCAYCDSVTEVK